MLTIIKKDTNIPNDQVVAVNNKNIVKVGFLQKHESPEFGYVCLHERGVKRNVTHFMTIENLLKSK